MPYSRWEPFLGQSAAYLLFKRHQTHFNSVFWSYAAAHRHAYAATRGHSPDESTSSVFSYAVKNRRLNISLAEWAAHFDGFDRWSRYASVLAISGYLELFLAQIASASLESCPSIILGGSREVNGVALLKSRKDYGFFDRIEPIIRGDWSSRVRAYKRLFGNCPFEGDVSDLERMRKIRNNAGHCFGRNIELLQRPESSQITRLSPISNDRLVKMLALADSVASDVEKHLAKAYVGCYEVIRLYHASYPKLQRVPGLREKADALNIEVVKMTGSPCGRKYAEAVMREYDTA
jgi:hypothetical protein